MGGENLRWESVAVSEEALVRGKGRVYSGDVYLVLGNGYIGFIGTNNHGVRAFYSRSKNKINK